MVGFFQNHSLIFLKPGTQAQPTATACEGSEPVSHLISGERAYEIQGFFVVKVIGYKVAKQTFPEDCQYFLLKIEKKLQFFNN